MSKLRIIIIVIAFTVSTVFLADVGIVYGLPKAQPMLQESDAVVVLGAGINSPALYYRTLTGLEVYEQNLAKLMVFSGGKIAEADISEAEYMEQVVMSRAIENPKYVLEDQSADTYQNINFTKTKLEEILGKPSDQTSLIIVSDEYHLGRAVMVAKRAGFETVYWRSPQSEHYTTKQLKRAYFRELVAMISYIPKFILG